MEGEGHPQWARVRRVRLRMAAVLTFAAVACAGWPVYACDLCAIYTATEVMQSRTGFRLGVGEQFTRFGTLQQSGKEVPNPNDEYLDSSITQVLLGYRVTPRFGLQLNIPIIGRSYRRLESTGVVEGTVTGFGDLSLIGDFNAFRWMNLNSVARFSVFGGLKLPSGDPSFLAEELAEEPSAAVGVQGEADHGEAPAGSGFGPAFHATGSEGDEGVESGIHGHDLALGSGSVDGIIGARGFWSWRRLFATANVQYLLRTEGAFSYQFANDLLWSGGPGAFLFLGHGLWGRDYSLGAQALLTGETKGNDEQQGQKATDTAITALYAGPAFTFTWGASLTAEIAADLPAIENNSDLQTVPDYRLRGGLAWRF
jgi:hypothetical protein